MNKSTIKLIQFKTMKDIENFVYAINKFDNIDIDIKYGKYVVDGKSYLGVLALGVCKDLIIEMSEYNEELINVLSNYNLKDF